MTTEWERVVNWVPMTTEPVDTRTLSLETWIARVNLTWKLVMAHKLGEGLGGAPYHAVGIELVDRADY